MKGSMLKRAKKKRDTSKLCSSPPKIAFREPIGRELPPSLQNFRWNVDKVERKLQEKIQEKTLIAGNFVYQQAYRLLEGTRGEGIDFPSFREQLRIKFGIILDDAELQVLFDKYDEDGNGTIDLHEFIRRVLPPDYNYGRQWFELSQLESEERAARLKREARNEFLACHGLADVEEVGNTGETSHWTMETLMKQIQAKVVQKTPSGEDQYRRAFKMLRSGRDQGIRMTGLQQNLKTKFGIFVSDQQMRELFAKCDLDSSGDIDIKEFLQFVDPPAYPTNSKVPGGLWTREDSDDDEFQASEDGRPASAFSSSQGPVSHRPPSRQGSVASTSSSNLEDGNPTGYPPARVKKERPKTANPRKTQMLQQRRQLVEQQRMLQAPVRHQLQPQFSTSMVDIHSADLDALSLAGDNATGYTLYPPRPHEGRPRAFHRVNGGGREPSEADTASVSGRSTGNHSVRPRSAGSVRSYASSGGSSVKGAAYMKRPPTPQSLRQKCLESRGATAATAAADAQAKARMKKRASFGSTQLHVGQQQQPQREKPGSFRNPERRHSVDSTSSARYRDTGCCGQGCVCSAPMPMPQEGEEEVRHVPRVVRVHAKQCDARPYTPEGRVLRPSKVNSSGCR